METLASTDMMAFLSCIRDEPDEDTHRLVFADWLTENGDSARGELIRVQVELARRWPGRENCSCELPDAECEFCSLKAREAALVAANPQWLSLPCPDDKHHPYLHCPTCGVSGDLFKRHAVLDFHSPHPFPPAVTIARLDRGLVVLTADAGRCWQPSLEKWDDRIRPTPWLKAVAACPWVVGVVVSDRVPMNSVHPDKWFWIDTIIPAWLLSFVGGEPASLGLPMAYFDSAELATRALSRAVLAWARALKGV